MLFSVNINIDINNIIIIIIIYIVIGLYHFRLLFLLFYYFRLLTWFFIIRNKWVIYWLIGYLRMVGCLSGSLYFTGNYKKDAVFLRFFDNY